MTDDDMLRRGDVKRKIADLHVDEYLMDLSAETLRDSTIEALEALPADPLVVAEHELAEAAFSLHSLVAYPADTFIRFNAALAAYRTLKEKAK
jgi:hypothetical protein